MGGRTYFFLTTNEAIWHLRLPVVTILETVWLFVVRWLSNSSSMDGFSEVSMEFESCISLQFHDVGIPTFE